MSAEVLRKVTIESKNPLGQLPVYVSSVGQHKAAVIVLQEAWGVNEHIKSLAHRWFADKYVVLVPDLYRDKVAIDRETAGHYYKDLNWKGAMQDIQASIDYLRSQGITKVGATGFCMGGALAIASSALNHGLDAAAPYYGVPSADLADPAKARTPLQCHFGTDDEAVGFSDKTAQDKLEQTLKENNINYEFYRYEGGKHAFANEARKECYNKEFAELAHKRTLEFFAKYLN